MTADKVKQLTRKLEQQGDVSLEEADWIYSLVEKNIEKNDPNLPAIALSEWYLSVSQKLENNERGNFIFSILIRDDFYNNFLWYANNALKKYGSFEDRVQKICINRSMRSLLPKHLRGMFTNAKLGVYSWLYTLSCRRAGLVCYPQNGCTISQFVDKLSAAVTYDGRPSRTNRVNYIVEYIKHNMPYMEMTAVAPAGDEAVVFIERDKTPIVKKALGIPFEDLVENALEQNIIDKSMAKKLLNGDGYIKYFPDGAFTEACIKYIDKVVQMGIKWKNTRETIEGSDMWLDQIR